MEKPRIRKKKAEYFPNTYLGCCLLIGMDDELANEKRIVGEGGLYDKLLLEANSMCYM